jgi:co-chaperonin GroES (HSP10)|tara:strand:- start:17 stop:277 length:261 start_codon:yes stop_codon:yes gene_type:complete
MKAIGNNLIVDMTKIGVSETKGGLFLAEKQREDIRYAEGTVLSVGNNVVGIKENDIIYFDKNNTHQIEIKKDIYQVVNMAHVVVVL